MVDIQIQISIFRNGESYRNIRKIIRMFLALNPLKSDFKDWSHWSFEPWKEESSRLVFAAGF